MRSSAARWKMMAPDSASIRMAFGALTATVASAVAGTLVVWARTACARVGSVPPPISPSASAAAIRPHRSSRREGDWAGADMGLNT